MNYLARIQKLLRLMREESLDAVLVTSPANRRYFSGFTGSAGCLFITPDEFFLFTDSRYTLQAGNEAKDFTVIDPGRKLFAEIAQIVQRGNAVNVGFEDREVTVSDYHKMTSEVSEAAWISLGDRLSRIRRVKDGDELKRIAIAEEIGDRAFTYAIERMKVGMSEKEAAFLLETSMRQDGASGLSFDTIVASGARGALPHGAPTDKLLQKGDAVVMDFGCIYEGYCSDMTRTVVMEEASDEFRTVYSILLQAQRYALQAAGPGVAAKELDAAARNTLDTFGYAKYFGHGLGHGVGIEIHEGPTASPASSDMLAPGMTVTVEPGVYLPDKFGIRIEDLIVIGEKGYQNLTKSPKELLVLKND